MILFKRVTGLLEVKTIGFLIGDFSYGSSTWRRCAVISAARDYIFMDAPGDAIILIPIDTGPLYQSQLKETGRLVGKRAFKLKTRSFLPVVSSRGDDHHHFLNLFLTLFTLGKSA